MVASKAEKNLPTNRTRPFFIIIHEHSSLAVWLRLIDFSAYLLKISLCILLSLRDIWDVRSPFKE